MCLKRLGCPTKAAACKHDRGSSILQASRRGKSFASGPTLTPSTATRRSPGEMPKVPAVTSPTMFETVAFFLRLRGPAKLLLKSSQSVRASVMSKSPWSPSATTLTHPFELLTFRIQMLRRWVRAVVWDAGWVGVGWSGYSYIYLSLSSCLQKVQYNIGTTIILPPYNLCKTPLRRLLG